MKMIGLLRGINVGGHRKVSMTALCSLASQLGFTEVSSYIQSGNLVFNAGKMKVDPVTALLEQGIEKQFGFTVDVVVRTATQWKNYAGGSPFRSAERLRPNLLLLGLAKVPCPKEAEKQLNARATQGEKIKIVGDAIWVDFVATVGRSKLTPSVFEKVIGSPVTLRNWNTVLKLDAMLRG